MAEIDAVFNDFVVKHQGKFFGPIAPAVEERDFILDYLDGDAEVARCALLRGGYGRAPLYAT